jgi:hypothetical protein
VKNNFISYLYFVIISFYEFFLKKRVFFSNRVVSNTLPGVYQGLPLRIYLLVRGFIKKSKIQLRWYNFIYLFVWACVYKDLTIMKNYFNLKLKRIKFKKHKKLFNLLRYIYYCATRYLIELGVISGFIFKVSGKIGLAGSVKTKSLTYAYGRTKLSSKGVKLKSEVTQL